MPLAIKKKNLAFIYFQRHGLNYIYIIYARSSPSIQWDWLFVLYRYQNVVLEMERWSGTVCVGVCVSLCVWEESECLCVTCLFVWCWFLLATTALFDVTEWLCCHIMNRPVCIFFSSEHYLWHAHTYYSDIMVSALLLWLLSQYYRIITLFNIHFLISHFSTHTPFRCPSG